MIDGPGIARALPERVLVLERSALRAFARANGESDPVYSDVCAARAAGYPDLPAPPTFIFASELDPPGIERLLLESELPDAGPSHREQGLRSHRPAWAGDTLRIRSLVSRIHDLDDGRVQFLVRTSVATNQHGQLIAELRSVFVRRA